MPFGKILDEAMRLVRQSFRTVYAPVAIPLTLISGATGVFQALWVQSMAQDAGAEMPTFSVETVILALVGAFAMGLGMVALQKAAVDVTAGRPADMKAAWRFALKPSVVGTLLLLALATIGSAVFCFFPVLYVAPLLSLTAPIMAAEGLFGPKALSRSAELARYNPQNRFLETPLVKALGLMVVTLLMTYAVAFVVVLPFQIPMYIDIFRKAASGQEPSVGVMAKWVWLQVPSQILQMLATVAVYAYSAFGYALLFFDARNRKEGSDLAAEINMVFGPGTPAGEPAP
jgi:hypothetical protein